MGGSVTRSGERSLSNSMNYFSNLYLVLYGDKVSSSSKCSKGITCQNVYGRAFDFRHDEFVKFYAKRPSGALYLLSQTCR